MSQKKGKSSWESVFLLVMLVLCCFFPFLIIICLPFVLCYFKKIKQEHDSKISLMPLSPQPRTRRSVTREDDNWRELFIAACESPAEQLFLETMIDEFKLTPKNGELISPTLTLAMQVSCGRYRFDFVANGRQVIEIDGAQWHSSPEAIERDRIRDNYSVEHGYRVLRIPAKTVFRAPSEAIAVVKDALIYTPKYTRPRPIHENPYVTTILDSLDTRSREP